MFKLLKRLGNYWWYFALMIITIIINVLADCGLPAFLGDLLSKLQASNPDIGEIALTALSMIGIAVISGVSAIITGRLASKITAKVVSVTRYDLYKKIGEFSSTEMNKFSVSSLVTRTTNDLTMISTTYNMLFRYALYGPLIAVVAIGLLFGSGSEVYQLGALVIIALVLMMAFIIFIILISLKKYRAIQNKLDKVTLITRENLEGLRVVRAYNAEKYQEEKFNNENKRLTQEKDKEINKLISLLNIDSNNIL